MIRILDIFLSCVALIVLIPLLAPVVFVLKISGEGEIFFLQERIGRHGKKFSLYKFATMQKNSPNIGTGTITLKNDPRILPIGKFLRKTKINELPQLLNILMGHMSVVGPRPLTRQTFASYPESIQKIVIQVRPGLSGVGSIIFRNEEEILDGNNATMGFYRKIIAPYKGLIEDWFVSHYGLRSYFLVIIVTLMVVVFPKTKLHWKLFKKIPVPPAELQKSLNYPT
jgi:lipopolysaccharide/colanic/teichoic acid biosynthesis glycosyltransferase